jgi:hypothetical protein
MPIGSLEARTSIASDIYSALGRSPETTQANVIATVCLTATVTFISQLVTMVDELYDRLVTLSKFTSEQATDHSGFGSYPG